ncbi:hypothetical protein GCM10027020_24700 [Nocardioides salsibiostraticola]
MTQMVIVACIGMLLILVDLEERVGLSGLGVACSSLPCSALASTYGFRHGRRATRGCDALRREVHPPRLTTP